MFPFDSPENLGNQRLLYEIKKCEKKKLFKLKTVITM